MLLLLLFLAVLAGLTFLLHSSVLVARVTELCLDHVRVNPSPFLAIDLKVTTEEGSSSGDRRGRQSSAVEERREEREMAMHHSQQSMWPKGQGLAPAQKIRQ
uniref:Secreted protein n=1 Tax=Oryza nivara TaxID=4536 RepID=A0A0E0G6W3_ORYNI